MLLGLCFSEKGKVRLWNCSSAYWNWAKQTDEQTKFDLEYFIAQLHLGVSNAGRTLEADFGK